jgi:hypothetical protein
MGRRLSYHDPALPVPPAPPTRPRNAAEGAGIPHWSRWSSIKNPFTHLSDFICGIPKHDTIDPPLEYFLRCLMDYFMACGPGLCKCSALYMIPVLPIVPALKRIFCHA